MVVDGLCHNALTADNFRSPNAADEGSLSVSDNSLNIALSVKPCDVSSGTAGSMWINGLATSTYDRYVPAVQIKAAR